MRRSSRGSTTSWPERSTLSSLRSPSACGADDQPNATPANTSNHNIRRRSLLGPVVTAAGANALLADGSVRFMNLSGGAVYHHDYYHGHYVERDLAPDWN